MVVDENPHPWGQLKSLSCMINNYHIRPYPSMLAITVIATSFTKPEHKKNQSPQKQERRRNRIIQVIVQLHQENERPEQIH